MIVGPLNTEIRPHRRCKRACLSGGTNTVSFSWGGGLFLQVNAWYVHKTPYFTAFWGPNSLHQVLVLQLCGKDYDKQNLEFRRSLAIWPDLTPSWVRMSGGKNTVKNDCFLNRGAWAEKLWKNCLKTSCFFCMSCQNTVNTSVFGWFALRTGSKIMKNTMVFAVHLKPLVEKTSQNSVFYALASKQCK